MFSRAIQGVVDSSGIWICSSVSGILYSQGSMYSIPLGRTYWIRSRKGVAYRTDTCSPLDRASDVLIYVEQLVRADRRIAAAE